MTLAVAEHEILRRRITGLESEVASQHQALLALAESVQALQEVVALMIEQRRLVASLELAGRDAG